MGHVIRSGRLAYHDALEPLLVDIDEVTPAPWNYNNGDVEVIAESIHRWGMWQPIKVQRSTGEIIGGNHTWMACKQLDAQQVPVIYLDVDDTTAKAIAIEDNESARKAMPDRAQMLGLLETIHDETGDYLASISERDVEVLTALAEIPVHYDEFAQWPTFSVQVHPRVLAAFMDLTREADTDAERFELMIRLAGWEG